MRYFRSNGPIGRAFCSFERSLQINQFNEKVLENMVSSTSSAVCPLCALGLHSFSNGRSYDQESQPVHAGSPCCQPARWVSHLLKSQFFTTSCDAHRHLRKNEVSIGKYSLAIGSFHFTNRF